MFVPFGEWLPDLPPNDNQGAITATNVIPDARSYLPFPSLVNQTSSLGSRCRGMIIARDSANNTYNYAGDLSALYVLSSPGWNTLSVGYTTAADDFWEFTQFGEHIIAVNGANGNVPQTWSLGAAASGPLAGSPPAATHIATIRDFVVLGNLNILSQRVQWSAINNSGSWTANAATLADFQDLPGSGGWIQKIVGGEYGTVFQQRAIFRMSFVGSPLVFQFDRVHDGIGVYAAQSVAYYQNWAFFLSEDGFYSFDGINLKPIGRAKVDNHFFNDLSVANYSRVVATIDPIRKLVAWAYPSSNTIGGNPDSMLLYSWAYDKWSKITGLDIQVIGRFISVGYTLEGLDAVSTSIETFTDSFDSSVWQGQQTNFAAFGSDNRLKTFTGSAMAATVDTTEMQLFEGYRSTLTEIRPHIEGYSASAQIAVISRNVLTESATVATSTSPNATGFVPVRNSARYHRIRMTTAANVDFEHLRGIEILGSKEGVR